MKLGNMISICLSLTQSNFMSTYRYIILILSFNREIKQETKYPLSNNRRLHFISLIIKGLSKVSPN